LKSLEVVYGEKFCHQESSAPANFKASASGGKDILTFFCDVEGVTHLEFMPVGTTVSSERY
jgi:hypothetical protein